MATDFAPTRYGPALSLTTNATDSSSKMEGWGHRPSSFEQVNYRADRDRPTSKNYEQYSEPRTSQHHGSGSGYGPARHVSDRSESRYAPYHDRRDDDRGWRPDHDRPYDSQSWRPSYAAESWSHVHESRDYAHDLRTEDYKDRHRDSERGLVQGSEGRYYHANEHPDRRWSRERAPDDYEDRRWDYERATEQVSNSRDYRPNEHSDRRWECERMPEQGWHSREWRSKQALHHKERISQHNRTRESRQDTSSRPATYASRPAHNISNAWIGQQEWQAPGSVQPTSWAGRAEDFQPRVPSTSSAGYSNRYDFSNRAQQPAQSTFATQVSGFGQSFADPANFIYGYGGQQQTQPASNGFNQPCLQSAQPTFNPFMAASSIYQQPDFFNTHQYASTFIQPFIQPASQPFIQPFIQPTLQPTLQPALQPCTNGWLTAPSAANQANNFVPFVSQRILHDSSDQSTSTKPKTFDYKGVGLQSLAKPDLGKASGKAPSHHSRDKKVYLLERPVPTAHYMQQASLPPVIRSPPSRLLVVIDLNGTLLHRPDRYNPTKFISRPSVLFFLQYLLQNHKVLVWSSSKPANVRAMCQQLLTQDKAAQLVDVWGRDKLRLTPAQSKQNVQVYKQLAWVWEDDFIQASSAEFEDVWDQSNTVLLDDSIEKAAGEPFNLIQIEEFEAKKDQMECDVLGQVVQYLEALKWQKDVSSHMKRYPFVYDAQAEPFDWTALEGLLS